MRTLRLSLSIIGFLLVMNHGTFSQDAYVRNGITLAQRLGTASLAPERAAPQHSLDLPTVATKFSDVTYLQYDNIAQDRPCTPVVVLDVPQFYAPLASAGPTKAWQVALLVRFRREDEGIEAGTPELFGCIGHCNGRMMLTIGNGLGDKERELQRAFHSVSDDLKRLSRDHRFAIGERPDPHFIYRRYAYVKSNPLADTDYYSDSDSEISASYFIRCNPGTRVPGCHLTNPLIFPPPVYPRFAPVL